MIRRVGIINLNSGNIFAVENCLRLLSVNYEIIKEVTDEKFTHLILPGVGSFDDYMEKLNNSGFKDYLKMHVNNGNYLLGICVGMQVLATFSEEGTLPGLNFIPGSVTKMNSNFELPHMGWNSLTKINSDPILNDVDLKLGCYYLHNYKFNPKNNSSVIISSCHNENIISGVIKQGNVYGIQFHPEKSHTNGLKFFKNFVDILC